MKTQPMTKFTMTDDDIKQAQADSLTPTSSSCPVATCIRRQLQLPASVGAYVTDVGDNAYITPYNVQQFVRAFDRTPANPPSPITFFLPIR